MPSDTDSVAPPSQRRSGAGKTTTVRILGTLIAPTAGPAMAAGIPLGPARAAAIMTAAGV